MIQLFFSIWKYDFGHEGPDALIRAILNDDPSSMQRIAASLHIDIQAIDTMWVLLSLQGADMEVKKKNERLALVSKVFLVERRKLALVDIVDDMVVMFMDAAAHVELQEGFADDYLNALGEETELLRLVVCPKLASTTDVRDAYLLIQDTAQEAFRIYPCRRYINAHELRFAQTCLMRFRQGEAAVMHDMAPLAPLQSADDYDDLIETLAVYLLDANSSTVETGEMMFIHKNTVKYRINKIKQRLGYDINKMPEYYALYLAVALKRLMK